MSTKFNAIGKGTEKKSRKSKYHKSTETMDNLITPPKKVVRDVDKDQKRETWIGNKEGK